jgi:zinc protease
MPFRRDKAPVTPVPPMPAPRRFSLENGLTVVHLEDRSAELVAVQLWVKTGSIHEDKWLGAGISHYLEHLLFKGTERRADGVIAREVQEHGGYINAYTTFDRTVYYVDLPAEAFGFGMDLLHDMAFHARLSDADITKEHGVIQREIAMTHDDPDRKVGRAAFRAAYRNYPYRYPVIGERALFDALEPDDLRSYYRHRYVPSNMVLVVVGAVDAETVAAALDGTFAKTPGRILAPVNIPREAPQLSRREERLFGDVHVCRGVQAFRIPHLAHPDAPALDLLASILGQGQSSLLWQQLREEQELVHSISAASWNPGESGLFWISYTCEPKLREQVEHALERVVRECSVEGFLSDQLDKARRQAVVSHVDGRKTIAGMASRLGVAEVVIGDLNYPENYLKGLEEVTTEDLRRVARKYLVPAQMTCVTYNAKSDVARSSKVEAPARLENFHLRTLPNGARLLWQRDTRVPKVHLRLSGHGGAYYETSANRGITALLATMLTRDTEWRRSREVAEAIEGVGGHFSEYVGNNTFGLCLEVMKGDIELARTLLEDAILTPRWLETTFLREQAAQLAELREAQDDIVDFGRTASRRAFFGDHPFAIEPLGLVETVSALTVDDLRAHYARLLVASNLVLTVVGDISPEKDLPLLEAFLMDLPDWGFLASHVSFDGPQPGSFRDEMDREQTVVFLSYPDVGVQKDEDMAGQLLDTICSDMSSELFRQVREERSLAYFVATSRTLGVDLGQFTFYAGTAPEAAEEVLEAMKNEARRLREQGPTQDELDRARRRVKVRRQIQFQSIASRAAHVSLNVHYGKPYNDWESYAERLDTITLADLKRFAARFTPENEVVYQVGPKVGVEAPVASSVTGK